MIILIILDLPVMLRWIFLSNQEKVYRLPKSLIMKKRIYEVFKSEKGYT
jgi:hypothetical protein